MDPITIVGSLASAVQLLDVSLSYSSHVCSFISALKHSKEDARLLQKTLQEVGDLMRELRSYASGVRASSSMSPQQQTLAHCIIQVSQHFAADMETIRGLLPKEPFPSLARRVKFVLQKSSLERALSRLDQRKSTAILTLEIIGRVDGSRHQDTILSLHDEVKRLSLEQRSFSEHYKRHSESSVLQSEQRENQIIMSLRELQSMITRHDVEIACRSETLRAATSSISDVKTNVATILSQQTDLLSASKRLERALESHIQVARASRQSQLPAPSIENTTVSTSTNLVADNADILARVLRAELRQQLEPLLQHVDGAREQIDRLVLAMSAKANDQAIFQTKTGSTSERGSLNRAQEKNFDLADEEEGAEVPAFSLLNFPVPSIHKEIPLSTSEYFIRMKVGNLRVILRTYRLRSPGISSQTRFFHLHVTFIPRPWLCSRGLSAIYSSGPNNHGYYSICPSIMSFQVLSRSSPIMRLIISDDEIGLRKMVAQGQVTFREQSEDGKDLFMTSLQWGSLSVCRYLLRETGHGEQFMNLPEQRTLNIWIFVFRNGIDDSVLERMRDVLSYIREFGIHWDDRLPGTSQDIDWFLIYHIWSCIRPKRPGLVKYAQILLEYGVILEPFWIFATDLVHHTFAMNLYLDTGGNPNQPDGTGNPPLYTALGRLFIFKVCIARRQLQDESESTNGESAAGFVDTCEEDTRDMSDDEHANSYMQTEQCISLLATLISAGADIYYIESWNERLDMARTLTDRAISLGIEEYWRGALEACGLDVSEVYAESARRLAEHRRLCGAIRTGIDIEPLVERNASSEMRYRGRRHQVFDI